MRFNLNDQSYDIDDELRVANILNRKASASPLSFKKNEDKYDYDLDMYYYDDLVGYVELEHSRERWDGYDVPESWYCYSFLNRKIEGKSIRGRDTNLIYYMKLNAQSTNCICVSFANLIKYGVSSERNGMNNNISNKRYDTYKELPLLSEYVFDGIDRSLMKILIKVERYI